MIVFYLKAHEVLAEMRTETIIEMIITGRIFSLDMIYLIVVASILLSLLKKFTVASLKTGVYVAMHDEKKEEKK